MGIARFSVNRPVAVTMRIAAIVLLGLVCLTRLPVDLLPAVSIPTVAVVTSWPNVAPEEIETQVTRPLEEAVSAAPNMYLVQSSSTEGSSVVRIQFNWGTDVGQGAIDVLQLVERARQNFPPDPTLQSPIVFKFDPSQLPILIMGVSGIDDPVKLRTLLSNQVAPLVESANGVAAAVITGGEQRSILVNADPDRLQAYHLSLSDLSKRISQENQNLPAGVGKESHTEYTIRSLGWFTGLEDIKKVPLASRGGQVIALQDVAQVVDSHSETRLYTRLNGHVAVGLIISKQSGANTIGTAQAVFEKIKEVQKLYPQLHFQIAYDQSQYIGNSINDLKMNAMLGGILAVLILMFFLRNIRSTLVVALSIPVSIISTFALLYLCGFTINTMSLGGLALATGLIVDDAVVVLENIFRHIERDKKSAVEAAVSGTGEILSAVVASTFTVMIVFLPLLLIKGQSGQMFGQFALVVIFSIAISLLDATTVVPMLASRLIQGEAHHETMVESQRASLLDRVFVKCGYWFGAMDEGYRNALAWVLRHRVWVLAAVTLITIASFLLIPQIGTEMMPQTDSGDFTVSVKMPPGTDLQTTRQVILQIEAILLKNPAVDTVFDASGTSLSIRGSTTSLAAYTGSLTVRLKDDRKASTQDVMADLRRKTSKISGARIFPNQYDLVSALLTGGNQNVEVDIFGADLGTLYKLARMVQARIHGVVGLENVDVNWQESTPEMQWRVDRDKALQMGVNFNDVASSISTATNGNIATYYQEGGFQYPVIVQVPEELRKTTAALADLPVTPSISTQPVGTPAVSVRLSQVARETYGTGPSEITRQDRQRYIAVSGTPQDRSAGEVQADVEKALKGLKLPRGYYWSWGVNQQRRAEEFSGMGLAIGLAIGLLYILLAAQFESFVHPLTVLVSVPLSAVGVILGLFLTGRAFGLTALIGLLMLVGIVSKNGILLVDYTNVLRGRGMSRNEAVLTAAPTRLRPILMTAFAAILGMMPLAIGLGRGSEIQVPMATAVIGGLSTSTFLTLFVVPTVYTLFDDLGHLWRRRQANGASPGASASSGSSPNGASPNGASPNGASPNGVSSHHAALPGAETGENAGDDHGV